MSLAGFERFLDRAGPASLLGLGLLAAFAMAAIIG
jgi:hypothetical protein